MLFQLLVDFTQLAGGYDWVCTIYHTFIHVYNTYYGLMLHLYIDLRVAL